MIIAVGSSLLDKRPGDLALTAPKGLTTIANAAQAAACPGSIKVNMPFQTPAEGVLLPPYRILDLAGPEGVFCGKLLADYGADVIKVEPPGGDAARKRPPFIGIQPGEDQPGPRTQRLLPVLQHQ